ncbi:DNA-3-methyladenine glycosylase I [Arthrobacter roseus]|uniref:DNA-3-methyladenine glycosylase I n=1 Tax=Arthrobacter roseus TaxID=136274 RepID=UPI0030840755|nr:DNA-3-methyladenine glycosylase I [Arthrobacter roseus]
MTSPPELIRTPWALSHPLLLEYYDTEWGTPVYTEQGLFERLSLEAFQAGLSWLTILKKRPAFRDSFHQFNPDAVAVMSDAELDQLMLNPDIIRNRQKIVATRNNARATITLREDGGLSDFLWSFKPGSTPCPETASEVPTTSPESLALSKALRKRGFSFVGPTTMYALMEAVGMVDTHIMASHRRGVSGIWPH